MEQSKNNVKESLFSMVISKYVNVDTMPGQVKRYLIGRRYNEEVQLTKKRYEDAAEKEDYEYIHTHRISNRQEIADRLSKEYGISAGTIVKYGNFAQTMEMIYEKNETIAKGVLSGETHLSQKDLGNIAKNL